MGIRDLLQGLAVALVCTLFYNPFALLDSFLTRWVGADVNLCSESKGQHSLRHKP